VLVVARHGRTEWNAAGRFQGWADVPLDAEGRAQSVRLAFDLKEKLSSPGELTVASSDLRRALETARALNRALGGRLAVEPDLREVDVGAWEGLTPAEARARFPAEWQQWVAGVDVRRGGGETLAEAGRRVGGCIEALLASAGRGPVVVVGHGMALQAGLNHLAIRGAVVLDGPARHLGNAECLVVEDSRHDQAERLLPER
jgi:probable phosphoglycerate mutase